MSIFRIPQKISKNADVIIKKFWWNSKSNIKHYCAFKSWKVICKSKTDEGLGFRSFHNLYKAFLSKLGCN